MKTKKGKERLVNHLKISNNKNNNMSENAKMDLVPEENKISKPVKLDCFGSEFSFAVLGQHIKGHGSSVKDETLKYANNDSKKKLIGKKTKGNSIVYSLSFDNTNRDGRDSRDIQSKTGSLNSIYRKEYEHILACFKDELSTINLDIKDKEEFVVSKGSNENKNSRRLNIEEVEEQKFLLEHLDSKKKGKNDTKNNKARMETLACEKNSTNDTFLLLGNLENNDSYNKPKTKNFINQNFFFSFKNFFNNIKLENNTITKALETSLLNNNNHIHIESNKNFFEILDKKYSEIFTIKNQVINFVDTNNNSDLSKENKEKNSLILVLKSINDFYNFEIRNCKLFQIFENFTEKLYNNNNQENQKINDFKDLEEINNENNNKVLKSFFNKKINYKNNKAAFKFKYKTKQKNINKKINVKMNENKWPWLNNDDNNLRKYSAVLKLNEDDSSNNFNKNLNLSDKELNDSLDSFTKSSKFNLSIKHESKYLSDLSDFSSIDDENKENKQNDIFVDRDFCISELNWKKILRLRENTNIVLNFPNKNEEIQEGNYEFLENQFHYVTI